MRRLVPGVWLVLTLACVLGLDITPGLGASGLDPLPETSPGRFLDPG